MTKSTEIKYLKKLYSTYRSPSTNHTVLPITYTTKPESGLNEMFTLTILAFKIMKLMTRLFNFGANINFRFTKLAGV